MTNNKGSREETPVISNLDDFDVNSGNLPERLIFKNRVLVVLACFFITIVLGYFAATKLEMNASFEKMIPQNHPFIQNYLDYKSELPGLGNAIRVVVENTEGDVFSEGYLEKLRQITRDLSLTNGVHRVGVQSLWQPSVRWVEVTEEGFRGDAVIGDYYDGSPESIEQLKQNVARSRVARDLVGDDEKSSMIFVPLMERDPKTKEPLDYRKFATELEDNIRAQYENGDSGPDVKVRIIGFAKLVGDLMDGLTKVATFFALAVLIAVVIIYSYSRCARSTFAVVGVSLAGVLWQLGVVSALGFVIDPFTILVPFVVFAIGVSHGAQMMNGILKDVGHGAHALVAARHTFRRLFTPGVTALISDAVGFAVLMVIDFPIIKDLAITASIGVAILIITNLIVLPVFLSYTGVNKAAVRRDLQHSSEKDYGKGIGHVWVLLEKLTERRVALPTLIIAGCVAAGAYAVGQRLQVGDLDSGAPELRADSQYNIDNRYITNHYSMSTDQFAVVVVTPEGECLSYEALTEADRLAWRLQHVPGVQSTVALPDAIRAITAGAYEGSAKWMTIARSQGILNFAGNQVLIHNPELANTECSVFPVIANLTDHKAATLERVSDAALSFAEAQGTDNLKFLLAAGSAGIEAATNSTVEQASTEMKVYVYLAVILLCLIAFRSWRAVVVAVVPLFITTLLCEALMVVLGLGIKVATLPVIALGVGIGVDYALYLLSTQLAFQRNGFTLRESYHKALQFTGRTVALVGAMLAVAVVTWVWSPIKFQADMGILLTFMFLANMVGALVLIPALSHFLLNSSPVAVSEDTDYQEGIQQSANETSSERRALCESV
ncbi:efflux RND transporter permease subunit [Marinobacter halotolerans]|uniref:efflux RND transporter permease subunit n=1 Tax=Marinobacter halotolerans TaxID=1569211 RepID=UPI0012458E6D|nr:MMPL family transporter [Marinobacter halotolerans]